MTEIIYKIIRITAQPQRTRLLATPEKSLVVKPTEGEVAGIRLLS